MAADSYTFSRTQSYHDQIPNYCWNTPPSATYYSENVYEREVTKGNNYSDWKQRISRGENATTHMFYKKQWMEANSAGSLTGQVYCNTKPSKGWQTEIISGQLEAVARFDPPDIQTLVVDSKTEQEAWINFLKNARRAQTAFAGGTFVAELKDTIRMIRNPALGIRTALDGWSRSARSYVRGHHHKSDRWLRRGLAQSWLEWSFGIAPLISDVQSGYRALNRLSRAHNFQFIEGKGTRSVKLLADQRWTWQSPLTAIVYWRGDYPKEYNVRYFGTVKIQVSSRTSRAIEESGFRIRDFAPAVWEAIPYSFLVDYFSNIGDLVEMASYPLTDLNWISKSVRVKATYARRAYHAKPLGSDPTKNRLISFSPGSVVESSVIGERFPDVNPLTPLSAYTIRLGLPGGFKKALNIGALASLRRIPR